MRRNTKTRAVATLAALLLAGLGSPAAAGADLQAVAKSCSLPGFSSLGGAFVDSSACSLLAGVERTRCLVGAASLSTLWEATAGVTLCVTNPDFVRSALEAKLSSADAKLAAVPAKPADACSKAREFESVILSYQAASKAKISLVDGNILREAIQPVELSISTDLATPCPSVSALVTSPTQPLQ